MKKSVDNLKEYDVSQHSVWRFLNDDSIGELVVSPVKRLPVKDLSGKLVFTRVHLANGEEIYAMFGNVDVENPELSKHFMTISFLKNNVWFHLARYHDHDYSSRGPSELADFLELKEFDIFPIEYDITFAVKQSSEILSGKYFPKPEKLLTRAEIIALAVP